MLVKLYLEKLLSLLTTVFSKQNNGFLSNGLLIQSSSKSVSPPAGRASTLYWIGLWLMSFNWSCYIIAENGVNVTQYSQEKWIFLAAGDHSVVVEVWVKDKKNGQKGTKRHWLKRQQPLCVCWWPTRWKTSQSRSGFITQTLQRETMCDVHDASPW